MWPGWSVDLGPAAGCDLGFTEAINKRMQVPNRLQVAGEDTSRSGKKPLELDLPPSFQMHVPDRLLLAEMTDVAFRPFLEKQLQQHCPLANDPLFEPSVQSTVFEEHPFLSLASKSGSQKRKRPAHQGRARKERTLAENPPLASGGQRHEWLDSSCPLAPTRPFPSFPLEGRIYTLQNVLQVLYFLGHQLFQLLWKPGRAQLSSQDTSLALESPLEELGATEILAMRKQLAKISGRLKRLEEQRMGWRQKELLVYSVLMSACLLNMWLWLRR